ncbi:MAG: hypothetical protein JNK82_17710 [Myxococcaceae bacterium]|nr:hypothetical protein [Myxococcaceae bacterium]
MSELIAETLRALGRHAAAALGVGALFVALWLLERRAKPGAARVFIVAAVALGLALACSVAWLCDDAFISFRYADNLARGHGLVFNVGERVEGYTNFGWAVLLAGIARLGGDLPLWAMFLNLASLAAALVLAHATVRRAVPEARFSFATLALATSGAFTTYGTSGLETMPAAALVCLALWLSARGVAPWVLGLVLGAATLTRPDQLLFGVALGVALLFDARPRQIIGYVAALAGVVVPWWLSRWAWYGDFYPNTYYAKSGGASYWSQGALYSAHFLLTTGALFTLLALALVARCSPRRLLVFAAASTALLGLYVTRVGGDFMEHRFFVSLLPVLFVALEVGLRQPGAPSAAVALGLAGAIVGGARLKPIADGEVRWNLAAEESFYRVEQLTPLRIGSSFFVEAMVLARTFTARNLAPRYGQGCVGMVGYYTGLPITDLYGVVDREVAHLPLTKRGRPGHERLATREYLLRSGVKFTVTPYWPGEEASTEVQLGGLKFWLLQDAPEVVEAFRAEGARVPESPLRTTEGAPRTP